MYSEDISGNNAIDVAFERNSIFSIKLFVDNLLDMTGESQFKNCFDKALLLMIQKGLDVKELVNSNLIYPPIWNKQTIFSGNSNKLIRTFNNDLNSLEFEDPYEMFKEETEFVKRPNKSKLTRQRILRGNTLRESIKENIFDKINTH